MSFHAKMLLACGALAFAGYGSQSDVAIAATKSAMVANAEASAVADATQAAWTSMDAARVEALYAPGVVGFDPMVAPLSVGRTSWTKLQKGFIDLKFDAMTVPDRNIQILDADNFIVSGTGRMTSTNGPLKVALIRFTTVYHRSSGGKWWIVNEHVSIPPQVPPG